MTDAERPERSPEPIHSSYKKPRDAQHDLMTQAVDGRVRGHIALAAEAFAKARIMRNTQGTRAYLTECPLCADIVIALVSDGITEQA